MTLPASHSRESWKVGILSDTHGMIDTRVLAKLSECRLILHAGDIVGGGVLAELKQRCDRLIAVRGNNDTPTQWPHHEEEVLRQIPYQRTVSLPGGDVLLTHGYQCQKGVSTPSQDFVKCLRERYPRVRAIIFGHTHKMVKECQTFPWVLNPGAAGKRLVRIGPSCLILEASISCWFLRSYQFSKTTP